MTNKIPDFVKPVIPRELKNDTNFVIGTLPPMDFIGGSKFATDDYETLLIILTKLNLIVGVVNDYTKYITEIMEWLVTDGLNEAVLAQLNLWLEDGTLANLINEILFTSKLDKITFEEFKEQYDMDIKNLQDVKLDKSIYDAFILTYNAFVTVMNNKTSSISADGKSANFDELKIKGIPVARGFIENLANKTVDTEWAKTSMVGFYSTNNTTIGVPSGKFGILQVLSIVQTPVSDTPREFIYFDRTNGGTYRSGYNNTLTGELVWHKIIEQRDLTLALKPVLDALIQMEKDIKDFTDNFYFVKPTDNLHTVFAEKKRIYISGDFTIDKTLVIESNTTVMSNNAKIRAKKGSFTGNNDVLMQINNKDNIEFKGTINLFMNKEEYSVGEWRHGLEVNTSRNIKFDKVFIDGTGGDGVYIGDPTNSNHGKDIYFNLIDVQNATRNGVSIISGQNIYIDYIRVDHTKGKAPEYAVDIEPNNPNNKLINVNVRTIISSDNEGALLVALGQLNNSVDRVTIRVGEVYSLYDNIGVRTVWNNHVDTISQVLGYVKIGKVNTQLNKVRSISHERWSIKAPMVEIDEATLSTTGGANILIVTGAGFDVIGNLKIKNVISMNATLEVGYAFGMSGAFSATRNVFVEFIDTDMKITKQNTILNEIDIVNHSNYIHRLSGRHSIQNYHMSKIGVNGTLQLMFPDGREEYEVEIINLENHELTCTVQQLNNRFYTYPIHQPNVDLTTNTKLDNIRLRGVLGGYRVITQYGKWDN